MLNGTRMMFAAAGLGSLMALAGCGADGAEPGEAATGTGDLTATEAAAPVRAEDAFLLEPPAGRDITMAGVTLTAEGVDLRLVGAEAAIADRMELHTMAMVDGQMTMSQLPGLDLPADTPVVLERGGHHLMLFGVESLDADQSYPLTLRFEDELGEPFTLEVMAPIRPLGG